jgi:hypothetical protein
MKDRDPQPKSVGGTSNGDFLMRHFFHRHGFARSPRIFFTSVTQWRTGIPEIFLGVTSHVAHAKCV